ncbi:MAG: glycosyltransferase [Clostridia bacterium]|nr:glycosyltransferase [Clostridia bacterium]
MRVLQVSMGEEFGGIEKMEFEIFKNFDKEFEFHFLVPNRNSFGKYVDEIKKLDGNVYDLGVSRKGFYGRVKYFFRLCKYLKKNKYDVVHINSSVFMFSFQVALISKITGVRKIIVHSHSIPKISLFKKIVKYLLTPIYIRVTDEYLACSNHSARALFTKGFIEKGKVKIIKNGIDIESFKFNESIRNELRGKYELNGKIVYGHVGRFDKVKNHEFLIDIFYEIQKIQDNSVLLLIGDGELFEVIKEKVNRLGISSKVVFLGFNENVNEFLNCMDCFIFPSLSEGFGLSIIEAQTNGLTVYCSNRVNSDDLKVLPSFRLFDLNDRPEEIAEDICKENFDVVNRKDMFKYSIEYGFDIKDVCGKIKKIYIS